MEDKNYLIRGPRSQTYPRHIGEILKEIVLYSKTDLAKGYRSYLASKEIKAEKGEM